MPQVFSHLSDRGLACLFKPTSQVFSRGLSVRIFKPRFCYQNSNANIRGFFTRVEERLKFTYIFSFNRYCAGFPQYKVICSKMIKNHSWNIKFNHFRLKIVFQNSKRSFQDIQQLHQTKNGTQFHLIKSFFRHKQVFRTPTFLS